MGCRSTQKGHHRLSGNHWTTIRTTSGPCDRDAGGHSWGTECYPASPRNAVRPAPGHRSCSKRPRLWYDRLRRRSTLHWVVHALHRGPSTAPVTLGTTMGGLSNNWKRPCGTRLNGVTAHDLAKLGVGHELHLTLPANYCPPNHPAHPFHRTSGGTRLRLLCLFHDAAAGRRVPPRSGPGQRPERLGVRNRHDHGVQLGTRKMDAVASVASPERRSSHLVRGSVRGQQATSPLGTDTRRFLPQ